MAPGASDIGAGSHGRIISRSIDRRGGQDGKALEKVLFEKLKLNAIFTSDEREKQFLDMSAIKAVEEASSGATAPLAQEKCAAHGARFFNLTFLFRISSIMVLKTKMEVMRKRKLKGLEDNSWMFALRDEDDLAYLLQVLEDKAKLVDGTPQKEEVDEDVFRTTFMMRMGVWEAGSFW